MSMQSSRSAIDIMQCVKPSSDFSSLSQLQICAKTPEMQGRSVHIRTYARADSVQLKSRKKNYSFVAFVKFTKK